MTWERSYGRDTPEPAVATGFRGSFATCGDETM